MKRFKKLTALLAAGAMAIVACLTAMPAMNASAAGNSAGGYSNS